MTDTQQTPKVGSGIEHQPEQSHDGYVGQVLDSELSPRTLSMLENLITDEWVLANFDEAEVHEQKWLSRVLQLEVEAMHPHDKSGWQGEYLAYAQDRGGRPSGSDDDPRALKALNDTERSTLTQLIDAHAARLTRSREMGQQEIFRTTIQRREQEDTGEEDGGWIR